MNNRPVQGAILIALLIFLALSLHALDNARKAGDSVLDHYKDSFSLSYDATSDRKMAKRIYAGDLMQRPLATDLTSIPKLFHQSWLNETLPAKFQEWSDSCRKAHPDWEWVLWTDADNLKLVEKFVPWFMDTYKSLKTEIYRADTARNIYMHVFGGVYADLDTECLLPYDSMFEKHNTSTVAHNELHHAIVSSESNEAQSETRSKIIEKSVKPFIKAERKVFLGRMGSDPDSENSIPNAWMASTPGHPFWLLPLRMCIGSVASGWEPERLTGPVALYDQVHRYNEKYGGGEGEKGAMLDKYYAKSGWRHLYKHNPLPQSLVILRHFEVYPYSWQRDGQMYKEFCSSSADTFDAERCKLLLGLDHWRSHSVTYWSHSWSGGGDGHWDDHLKAISKPNKKPSQKPGDQDEGDWEEEEEDDDGDATEANKEAEKKEEAEKQEELDEKSGS